MTTQFEDLSHPTQAEVVVPDDAANLPHAGIIYVGGDGDIEVITSGGDTVTYVGLKQGTWLPVHVTRVKATGTTATNLIVNY